MAAKELALHETLEVHEILVFKTACVTKGTAMLGFVEDEKLKKILEGDIKLSVKAIEELKDILGKK